MVGRYTTDHGDLCDHGSLYLERLLAGPYEIERGGPIGLMRAFLLQPKHLSLRTMNRATLCGIIPLLLFSAISGDGQDLSSPPQAAVISPDNPTSFDPAAATQAWLETVPQDQRAKSDAYFEGTYWLILWNFVVGAAISIFLLASRLSARLRQFAEGVARSPTLQVVLY